MTARFSGRTAVVLGGNSGIGLATARAFAEEGARVVITGRNPETLRSAISEVGHGAIAFKSDMSDLGDIAALFKQLQTQLGHIDILCVNAGVLAVLPIEAVTEDVWDSVLDANLKGVFFTIQAALPLMPRGSSIVTTGSTAGRKGVPSASTYCASKAGLRGLVRALAAELLKRGIRVNVVSPGPTDTPIFHRAAGLPPHAVDDLLQREIQSVPMKRLGTPGEVAAAVLFLASDAAAFITGIDFAVDGGTVSL